MSKITASVVKELREKTGIGMMECKNALVDSDGDIEVAIDNLRKAGVMKAAKKSSRLAQKGAVINCIASDYSSGYLVEINSETDFVASNDEFVNFSNDLTELILTRDMNSIEQLNADSEVIDKRNALIHKVGENIVLSNMHVIHAEHVNGYIHGGGVAGALVGLNGGDKSLAREIAMHVVASKPMTINPEDIPVDKMDREKEIYRAQAVAANKPDNIIEKVVEGSWRKFVKNNCLTKQVFIKDSDYSVGDILAQRNAEVVDFVCYIVGEGCYMGSSS